MENMEKEFRKIIEDTKQIKLSSKEKEKMRERLRLFIEHNPVREEVHSRPQLQQRSWFFYQLNQLRLKPMPIVAIVAVIVLIGGGGTSLAAESSLPGDFLYPVKVNVNEEVRGTLALSDEAKARLEASLAERRLQEAAELAAKGRLTTEAQTEIESRFKAHVDKFETRANKLAAEGKANAAAEISSNLVASLQAHGQILDSFEAEAAREENRGVRVKVQPLVTAVQVGLGTVEGVRMNAETQVSAGAKADVEAAAEGKLKAATNKISEVRSLIERTKGSLSASTTALADTKLELAEKAIAEGKVKLEADAFAEAFASFDEAHRLAQEVQILINGSQKFKIDLDGGSKYKGCPIPVPMVSTMVCSDGSIAGPSCVDGHWVIKQCSSTSSEIFPGTRIY